MARPARRGTVGQVLGEHALEGDARAPRRIGGAHQPRVVVQGEVERANGTAAVIYSETVLNAIGQNPNNNRFATLPGAWNDRSTY